MNIINEIKNLNIPNDDFVVVGSSILAMKGIRGSDEIDDIDLLVSEKVFENLKKIGWQSKTVFFDNRDCENLVSGIFEAGREYWDRENIDFFTKNPDRIDEFDGIRFQSLKEFYNRKKNWGRPKDLEDIDLVEAYFKTSAQ